MIKQKHEVLSVGNGCLKVSRSRPQAVWRGRQVRRACRDKRVAAIRARCIKAAKAVTEEKRLCNRTTSALDYLLQYRQMSGLLEALISLGGWN